MVDPERLVLRLARLDVLLVHLEGVRARGLGAYLADPSARLACERALTLAEQIVVDIAAQVVAERGLGAPAGYAEAFGLLAAAGIIDASEADALADASRQRHLLIHLYLEIDDRLVFASLDRLDVLRRFAEQATSL